MFKSIDEMLEGAIEVKLWQYWLWPLRQIVRHPFGFDNWYLQLKQTITDGDKVVERHYYVRKVGDV